MSDDDNAGMIILPERQQKFLLLRNIEEGRLECPLCTMMGC
jgi:hypothetical protein